MDIDIDRWRAELLTQKKTFVYGAIEGRGKLASRMFQKSVQ